MIHTCATVAGIFSAIYGLFHQDWRFIAGGVLGIYEAGFHSHLFIEKNIPSSTRYPKQSVYSDLRITFQTLLNPITKGMDGDLMKAGMNLKG